MIHKTITIINKLGLHARAAMKLVHLANRYQSEILIRYNEHVANAKSILNVMILAATQGAEIQLTITGEDEEDALEKIIELINNRFGEQE